VSAWAEIVYADNSEEWTAMCARALAEVQAEQQRKDAAKIRNDDTRACAVATQQYFANLIDSEVSSDAPQAEE
jgi:hypothetical protein